MVSAAGGDSTADGRCNLNETRLSGDSQAQNRRKAGRGRNRERLAAQLPPTSQKGPGNKQRPLREACLVNVFIGAVIFGADRSQSVDHRDLFGGDQVCIRNPLAVFGRHFNSQFVPHRLYYLK